MFFVRLIAALMLLSLPVAAQGRWIDNSALDGFVQRLLAALK